MRFEVALGRDGALVVQGTRLDDSQAAVFQRAGRYRLQGNQLISDAVNRGQPVDLRMEGSRLVLDLGDGLAFRLRRRE